MRKKYKIKNRSQKKFSCLCTFTAVLLEQCNSAPHRVHRVATDDFWRAFNHEGKNSPGW
jgi:hypothetical protein